MTRLFAFLRRRLRAYRWRRTLLRLYPTREAFAIQIERRLDTSARTVADAYRMGYSDGAEQGYVTGYADGAQETLRIAKKSLRKAGREAEKKAWVQ